MPHARTETCPMYGWEWDHCWIQTCCLLRFAVCDFNEFKHVVSVFPRVVQMPVRTWTWGHVVTFAGLLLLKPALNRYGRPKPTNIPGQPDVGWFIHPMQYCPFVCIRSIILRNLACLFGIYRFLFVAHYLSVLCLCLKLVQHFLVHLSYTIAVSAPTFLRRHWRHMTLIWLSREMCWYVEISDFFNALFWWGQFQRTHHRCYIFHLFGIWRIATWTRFSSYRADAVHWCITQQVVE